MCCSEDKLLQSEVISVLPLVQNVNAMADEMQKPVAFSMMLVSPEARGLDHGRTEVSLDSKNNHKKTRFLLLCIYHCSTGFTLQSSLSVD